MTSPSDRFSIVSRFVSKFPNRTTSSLPLLWTMSRILRLSSRNSSWLRDSLMSLGSKISRTGPKDERGMANCRGPSTASSLMLNTRIRSDDPSEMPLR